MTVLPYTNQKLSRKKCLEQLCVQGIFIKRAAVAMHGYKNKGSEMAIHFRA